MSEEPLVDVWIDNRIYSINSNDPEWNSKIKKKVSEQVKKALNMDLYVKLELFLTKGHDLDIDNIIKAVFDILHRPEPYPIETDALICKVEATKIFTDETDFQKEKTHIEIWKWNELRETKKALARLKEEYERKT
jgi:Holliday junction resolvase RusA-like endonuclease